jgi:hypothetical protein
MSHQGRDITKHENRHVGLRIYFRINLLAGSRALMARPQGS